MGGRCPHVADRGSLPGGANIPHRPDGRGGRPSATLEWCVDMSIAAPPPPLGPPVVGVSTRAPETAPGFARLPRAPVCDVATPLPLGDSGRMDRSAGANRPSPWPRAPHPPKAPFDLVLHGTPPLV